MILLIILAINISVKRETLYWPTIIIILSIVIYAWLKQTYAKRIQQIGSSFFVGKISGQLIREYFASSKRISFLLHALLCSNIALIAIKLKEQYVSQFLWGDYFKIAVFFAISFYLKQLIVQFLGIVFKKEPIANDYRFNIILFNNFLAILLLPVVVFIYFQTIIFFTHLTGLLIVVLALIVLFKTYKAVISITKLNQVALYYLFLYLCIFEILPVFVVGKFAYVNWLNGQ